MRFVTPMALWTAMIMSISYRSVAFVPLRSTTRFSYNADRILRGFRPKVAPMSLAALLEIKSAMRSTTERGADLDKPSQMSDTALVDFPLKGQDVDSAPPRMRFAPSPTGSLHVGGARTALYNWLVAKKGQIDAPNSNAAFVLRVEDTDLARSTKESEDSVLQDLTWLGLNWDEGPDIEPKNDVISYGPYRQSERNEIYVKVAEKLLKEGKAYRCFCTKEELDAMREQQEKEGIPPRYDGTWRDADPDVVRQKLEQGDPFTVRFKVPAGARVVIDDAVRGTVGWDAESTVGDFILMRSNGVPVYNFCVAVDDAAMGITTVIRAEEHLTNTLRQGLILDALEAPRPRYAHCSLILGEDKQKLSKRHGATSCNQFRLDGFLPDAMINYLSLLGWNDGSDNEIYSREELVDAFEVDRIVKSPSVFDMDKLRWVNAQHLKAMTIEETVPLVTEQFELEGMVGAESMQSQAVKEFSIAATSLAKQMMETTRCAVTNAKEVLGYSLPQSYKDLEDGEAKDMIKMGHFYVIGRRLVQAFEENKFPMPDDTDPLAAFTDPGGQFVVEDNQQGGGAYSYPHAYKVFMKSIAKELGIKGKFLFHPIRLALTGEMSGQDVTKQLSLVAMAGEPPFQDQENVRNLIVTFEERMNRLKAFLDTVPEEFHVPVANRKGKNNSQHTPEDNAAKKKIKEASASEEVSSGQKESYAGPPITALDIRVGLIKRAWEHEEADKLFCEEVDVGEGEDRKIASGLRPFFNREDLENRKVLVLCNLKERKMLGFPSHGMVLCASNEDHSEVCFVSPPPDAKIGERVTVPGYDFDSEDATPFAENKVGKKKVFEKIAPFLKTSEHGVPEFLGSPLMTSAGVCTSPMKKGQVS